MNAESEMKQLLDKANVRAAFRMSLVLKGAIALAEVAAGSLAYLVTPQFVLNLVQTITRTELTEDPRDFVANHLLHAAQDMSVSGQHFAAFYLLGHGVVKLWLIIGLWRERLAYYPIAIGVFALFIVYQMYRYSFTRSVLVLLITLVDVVVIWLVWMQYRDLRQIRRAIASS
jgi:uncharacterized membrane protein